MSRPTASPAIVAPLLFGVASAILGIGGAVKGSALALVAGIVGLAAGLFGARELFAGGPPAAATRASDPVPAWSPSIAVAPVSAPSVTPSELPDRGRGPAGGIHDPVTGLFNEHYFAVAVDSRVAAARRHLRPVAIIQLSVSRAVGTEEMADPVAVSNAVRATLRDSDTACRMDDGRFAIILEDTPEEGAILTAERLRRAMGTAAPDHVQRAGVACYPAHAFNAGELLIKSEKALRAARDWPQHRIEVAAAD
jgi:diguanylate cyclase (GGDEF)-like protein